VLINRFGKTHVETLLPPLQEGLFSIKWRIRQSSVELLGSLLFSICGITAQANVLDKDTETEGTSTAAQGQAIMLALGQARRDDILSSVYVSHPPVKASLQL
jgi:hypothetical protein